MIRSLITKVVDGTDLSEEEAMTAMEAMMSGEATSSQISSFITALRMKGETVDEIVGCARVMREKAHRIQPKSKMLIDTCGTGGDGANTFNISTTAAFVVAGAGLPVAKHGARSVSSRCGSADVLEALGVDIDLTPEQVEDCIDDIGIGFLFAPIFHEAMKQAAPARKEIGIRTIFNVLGPLTNPANATRQVVGVYAPNLTPVLAEVLAKLGVQEAFVVHGLDRLDEISISERTLVSHMKDGSVRTTEIEPETFGLRRAGREEIKGGDAEENAELLLAILEGRPGPRRDIVLLNAAAALTAGGLVDNLNDGVALARETIDSGKAMEKLLALRTYRGNSVA